MKSKEAKSSLTEWLENNKVVNYDIIHGVMDRVVDEFRANANSLGIPEKKKQLIQEAREYDFSFFDYDNLQDYAKDWIRAVFFAGVKEKLTRFAYEDGDLLAQINRASIPFFIEVMREKLIVVIDEDRFDEFD